jgi:hypothetical protein
MVQGKALGYFFSIFLVTILQAQEPPASLLEALTYAPKNETLVAFTNLTLIKTYEEAGTLTSDAAAEDRLIFLEAFRERQVALVGDLLSFATQHAEVWSWDLTDLRWALELSGSAPTYVLAFQEKDKLIDFTKRLEERDFSVTTLADATLYQHEMDLTADWFPVNLRVVNTAVLQAESVVIMSASLEALENVLLAHSNKVNYASVPSIQTVTEHLGETAALVLDKRGCQTYGLSEVLGELDSLEQVQERLEEQLELKLHPYQTLALNYRYEAGKPLGTLIMNYPTIADPQADLAKRQKLAEEGLSLVTRSAYKESVFGLESTAAVGNNLIFKLRPVDNQPRKLFEMFYQRDMSFASC